MKAKDAFSALEISDAIDRIEKGDHHPLGPSSIYRVRNCPASAIGSVIFADIDSSNEHSKRGTRIHKAIEEWIETGVEPDCDSEEARHLENAKIALGRSPRLWQAEVRLSANGLFFGRADAVKIKGEIGYIYDWKTGLMAEASEQSYSQQLLSLSHALMCENPSVKIVYASAVYTETGTMSKILETTRQFHLNFMVKISGLLHDCKSGECSFAGCSGSYCKYCKVESSGRCPVKNSESARNLGEMGLVMPASSEIGIVAKADEILLKCNQVSKAIEIMAKNAKETIKLNGGSDHFFAVECKGRKTTDWEQVAKDANIPSCIIERNTTIGEPIVSIRARSKTK